jgi:glyoxylase-like metal-dependent hydrolase (beta-lactamase superfamily II)
MDFSGDLCSNAIVLKGPTKLVVVDPGTLKRLPDLKAQMIDDGLNPADIESVVLTHSHPDHIESAPELAAKYGARLYISRIEREFLLETAEIFFTSYVRPGPDVVFDLCDEGPLIASGVELRLISSPGHTPGSLSVYVPQARLLMTGDLFFPGTIGAIDLPGGCPGDMYKSVARLRDLGGVAKVLCGHGPAIIDRYMIIQNYRALFAEIAAKKAAGIV